MLKKILLFAIICMGIGVLVVTDRLQGSHWRAARQTELHSTTKLCKIRLENALVSRFNAVEALSSLFALHPETTAAEFAAFAAMLLQSNPPIRALQYADSSTRVSYVYPSQENEITVSRPMILLADPERGPSVRKAIDQRQASLQGPLRLRQGGTGLVVRSPIFVADRFMGLAIGVYDVSVLLSEALAGVNLDQFGVRLLDGRGRVFWGAERSSGEVYGLSVLVADSKWTIELHWRAGAAPPLVWTRLVLWGLGGGFLLSTVLLIHFSWAQAQRLQRSVREQTKALSTTNKLLVDEIAVRQLAEDALRASKDRFETVIIRAPIPMVVIDPDQHVVLYNNKFTALFGYTLEDISTMEEWWLTAYPDERYRQSVQKSWQEALASVAEGSKEIEKQDWEITSKDGTVHRVEFKVTNLGQIALVAMNDITERRQAEEELKRYYNHLEELVSERTLELEVKNRDLERMNDLFVGREFRIKELRDRLQAFEEQED
ncbi:MAG: PAS domain S-box protein [Proteobacteria bacterium]|nr:PAS domain S-box protein [Pseudomonadota bacterium]